MKSLVEFLIIWSFLYFIGFINIRKGEKFDFMSKVHTNICRAVAAFIIILQHVAGGFGVRYFTPLGGIGVAIFLILSGYGLNESYKYKGIGGGYWKPKIIRVLLPYLMIRGIVFVCGILGERDIFSPTYWYISCILFWYFIFWIIIRIPNLYSYRYLILGISSIGVFIIAGVLNNGLWAEQACSFFLGVLISDNYEKAKKKILNPSVIVALLFIGGFLLAFKQLSLIRELEGLMIWQGIQLMMKLSVAVALIGITYILRVIFNNRFIDVMGVLSFEVYLIHINILSLPNNGIIGMSEFIIVTVLGAWIMHCMVESIKKRLIN